MPERGRTKIWFEEIDRKHIVFVFFKIDFSWYPIGSMYGIYANIGGIWMVNVTIYSSTMDPMGI